MFDKILGKLGLDGGDYYDDDMNDEEAYDDGDDFYDDEPRKSSRASLFNGRANDSDDTDKSSSRFGGRKDKVVPMQSSRRSGLEVCVIRPQSIEDAREITDTLKDGKAVVLNLEGVRVEVAQRIIDFVSGSCYAINGNIKPISDTIVIVTPEDIDITGDLQELASSSVNVPAFGYSEEEE